MAKKWKVGVVMDPISEIKPYKDTSLAVMLEMQSRGWELFCIGMEDLVLRSGKAEAFMTQVQVHRSNDHWYDAGEGHTAALSDLDMILMRKDPPFDMEYITATYILERAQEQGVFVSNDPRSIRDENEKICATAFPKCSPESLVSRNKETILDFLDSQGKIVLKPLDLMGGQSIYVLEKNDPNARVTVEDMTHKGSRFIQAQAYLPDIRSGGDKRIMLIDGEAVPFGITRLPRHGDHRGNMAVGAEVKGFELSEHDHWICGQIGPVLKEKGLHFVGIDVIGEHLTEINVTSPTGIVEIDKLYGTNIAGQYCDFIESKLQRNDTTSR